MSTETPVSDIKIGKVTQQWAEQQKIVTKYFEKTDSTNSVAKKEAFHESSLSENVILYLAEQQSAGRGRGKNTWSNANNGSQLLSTWSFMVEENPHPTISPMIGLALYRAALSTWPFLDWNLKAPNDLYIHDKKIAGLLLETITQGDDHRLLLGLGFNVFHFPSQVENATSLLAELPSEAPLLAQDWISFLERLLFEFAFSLQLSFEPLNSTSTQSLLTALNLHPLLSEKYISMDENANLKTSHKKISWMEL